MHLVLSTPPGTNRDYALKAAKEFLESEYKAGGHEYLFVAHNDTDHPHVHAVIKMLSSYSNKLNPRKEYLHQVRQKYVKTCQSYGIEVEASPRTERGLSGPSTKSEFVQMRRTGRKPHADINLINKIKVEHQMHKVSLHPSKVKMLKRNQIIRRRYADKAKSLEKKGKYISDKVQQGKYLTVAAKLFDYAKIMPVELSRGEKLHQQIDKKMGIISNSTLINKVSLNLYEVVTASTRNQYDHYVSPQSYLNEKLLDGIAWYDPPNSELDIGLDIGLELED
jgi:hypothetical protein